jgi:hypothetical protein
VQTALSMGVFRQPLASSQLSAVHGSASSQGKESPSLHTPAPSQVLLIVQTSPSLQLVVAASN